MSRDVDNSTFDLVERPWLLVQRLDGPVEEVSIAELVARAHELRTVVGEVPTQTFALVRMLLAILHRAIEGPSSSDAWALLWRDATLPVADVAAYLSRFRERFDLLHPTTPFYQVADLHTARDEVFGLDRLIADVPAGEPYFTTRLGWGVERVTFAEAARWLVHCQAFDPSGIKSGAVGDPRVKNGKGYPIGTGWAGALGGILAEGRNLRETLLLNLIPDDSGLDIGNLDSPVWEREPHTAEPESGGREPYGPLDLYTWQSRRVRLFSDAGGVYGVLVANGDKIMPQNRHTIEPFSAWRRSETQEKKLRRPLIYMPREHQPERAIWRGLEALLPRSTDAGQKSEAATHLAPPVLKWLGAAQLDDGLRPDYRFSVRAIGMRYGSQQATTAEIVDDAVTMAVVLLHQSDRELGAAAIGAVHDAEAGAVALGNLAANIAAAGGGETAGPEARARELAYAEIDRHFREWLAGLGPDSDPLHARREWQQRARHILRGLGADLVEQAGPAAWVGREVKGRHVSTPEADGWFRRQLSKTLPLAYETDYSEVAA